MSVESATAMAAAGDHAAAAAAYSALADWAEPPESENYRLAAAEAYLNAGQPARVAETLQGLRADELSPEMRARGRLIGAAALIAQGRAEEALQALATPLEETLPAQQRIRYHRLRADAMELAGDPLAAAKELSILDGLITDPGERLTNQQQLVRTLNNLSDTALSLMQPYPPDQMSGWMALTRIAKAYAADPNLGASRLQQWRENFPDHPSATVFLPDFLVQMQQMFRPPGRIGLILPRTGPLAQPAKAVLEGFVAAYFNQDPELRPEVRIYDSNTVSDIRELYRRAVADGAEMVVGPLGKKAVTALAETGEFSIPVLALNQAETESQPASNFFQYGLPPEDEARQVAERAWLDGFTRATVLWPGGSWGERVFEAFRGRWAELGGQLLEDQQYASDEYDFSDPIRALFNIDESEERIRRVEQVIGRRVEAEPRRRQDVEFIFLAAFPRQARAIRPQLLFHRAVELPVYATSHIDGRGRSGTQEFDLEGLFYCDIPWLFDDNAGEPLSRAVFARAVPEMNEHFSRLYAMGMDAYHLLPHLTRLLQHPEATLNGKTGFLHIDAEGRIHRRLVWARIVNGTTETIGQSPSHPSAGGPETRPQEPPLTPPVTNGEESSPR